MRISDWSSDVCSSDLGEFLRLERFGDGPRMRPFGMIVPDVQPVASDLPFRQMLKQQPARDAPRLGIVTRREPDQARDLLRLPEIMLGGIADRCALERHDALIALAACRLVEGDRQESLAEQGDRKSTRLNYSH